MAEQPHWEHGYRSHGYWLGLVRFGWVSLPPFRATDYGWEVNLPGGKVEGRVSTLREAKRLVEGAYRAYAVCGGGSTERSGRVSETKRFSLGVVLTVTTERLLSDIGDWYGILGWMARRIRSGLRFHYCWLIG